MGLKGSELVSFVREQQTLENERKAKEEERKAKEEERLDKVRLFEIERGKLELKRGEQASMEKEKERQLELEREERARQEKERERQLELEQKEEERQEKERERQFEMDRQERELQIEQEKHKQEMEKLDFQAKMRKREARTTEEGRRRSEGNGDEVPIGKAVGKIPKIPYFEEERDFMDSYLGRFERFAETQKWKREHWAMYLSALLKGRALDVYSRMPSEQAGDYDRLKDALLKRYLLSADGFRKRFLSA